MPDRELLGYPMDSVREFVAWISMVEQRDLPLAPDQVAMARERCKSVDDTVWFRLIQAYNTPSGEFSAVVFAESISGSTTRRTRSRNAD